VSGSGPQLAGQTVIVIGGSSGIGLETARLAAAEGADVTITGRDPGRLEAAAREVGARRTAAFDAFDAAALKRFFADLPGPIDHVLVTAGAPAYGPLLEMDAAAVSYALSNHIVASLEVARNVAGKLRAGGSLLLIGGTGGRRIGHGLGIASAATAALPPSPPRSRLSWRRPASTSSPPGSSIPRCRRRCSGTSSRRAVTSSGRSCRSAGSSAPPTSPRWPCTSWSTRRSPARPMTSTGASSSPTRDRVGARRAPRRRRRPGRRQAGRPGRARRRRCRPGAACHGCPSARSCTPGRSACRHRSRRSPPGRCRRHR
jgi:NAD(P)-dependent dehydrogenase (short-subunit alcohol dehydrogenase family)